MPRRFGTRISVWREALSARASTAPLSIGAVALLFVIVGTTEAGVYLKSLATPPGARAYVDPLGEIDVYTTDPAAAASLTISMGPVKSGRRHGGPAARPDALAAELSLSVQPAPGARNVGWLVVVTAYEAFLGRAARTTYPPPSHPTSPRAVTRVRNNLHEFVYKGDLASLRRRSSAIPLPQTTAGAFVGLALFPLGMRESRGSLDARLPAVASGERWSDNEWPRILELPRSRRKRLVVVVDPIPQSGLTPLAPFPRAATAYQRVLPGASAQTFFVPRRLATTVELDEQSQRDLSAYRFDSINPSTYTLRGSKLVWRGSGDLQPAFTATSFSAAERRSDDAFYSGIAFGLAGAALIAFLQELPRRRREE